MKRSKGFTLVELLVVIAIIGLLLTILMPTLGRARDIARRTACGATLNALGKQIQLYIAEFEQGFPLFMKYGDAVADITEDNTADDIWEGADTTLVLGENAMQSVWLLVKSGASENLFKCPGDKPTARTGDDIGTYGWTNEDNYSYSMHKPYEKNSAAGTGDPNKAPLTASSVKGSLPIFADKLTYDGTASDVTWINKDKGPTNHPQDGFNFLTYEGSVSYYRVNVGEDDANSLAGISGDDIYFAKANEDDEEDKYPSSAQTGAEMPIDTTDSFILPWLTKKADNK